ncbi:MAG: hypothetical protein R3212_11605, partial [Xanthomonadales bacterium]|nr:hypothetical protein [Xanthomonadales bacterium]
ASELSELKYQQAGDVIYFTHPDHPTFKLERRGNSTWSLVQVYWEDGPWGEINPTIDLTDRQLNPNPDFLTGMDSWDNPGSGNDARTLYDGSQQIIELQPNADGADATAEVEVPTGFRQGTSTTYVAHFLIVGSFEGAGVQGTEVRVGSTSGNTDIVAAADFVPGWHTITYTTASATNHFYRFRVDRESSNGGVGALFVYAEDALLLEPSDTVGSITVDARGFSPFRSGDKGRAIRFEFPGREPGWGIITTVNTASQVTLQVRREIPRALPTESWRLGSWSDRAGYPETMAFFEGRSVLANNATERRTMWFSQSQDLENMRPDSFVEGGNTVEDDDALNFALTSPQASDIRWLSALQQLLIGTLSGPWVSESNGPVLTPNDRGFRQQTSVKMSDRRPILAGNAVVFIDQARKRLYDLGFQFEPNAFVAADLTSLADHVSNVQIESIAYQEDPDPIIWVQRDIDTDSDGQIYTLAYNREENIVGWSRHELGGSWSGGANGKPGVNSIVTIPGSNDSGQVFPSGDRDEVWAVVTRTVNSSTVRFIEFFEGEYSGPDREDYATESAWIDAVQADMQNCYFVDAGITYSGASTSTITGLDHLEGETVTVLNGG